MMKLRNLFENFDLARLALENYAHDEQTLDLYLRHFRISSNAVYPYANNGVRCFLRLAPVEEKQQEMVEAEIAYIQYLRQAGYPAMKPIPDCDGRLASLLDSPWGMYCVSAFEGVPGRPMEEALPDGLFEMGRTLGWMHALSREYQPVKQRPDHWKVLMDVRRMLEENHAPAKTLERLDDLSKALEALPVTRETYGLLHYDFEPDNVFWNGEICSVIDFDDSMFGWFALDVEQALEELGEEGAALFMQGYRSISPFTEEMEAQRPLMRKFIQLRGYARLLYCLSDEIPDPPGWMVELRQKLNTARKRLEETILQS